MDWEALDRLIDELDAMIDFRTGRGVRGLAGIIAPTSFTWADIWSKATEIQGGFKGTRYPSREQHDRAWERFSGLRSFAATSSTEERDRRRSKSESRRSEILARVESAKPSDFFGFDPVNIDEMKALGRVLRDAGAMLGEQKQEMLAEHKQECFDAIQKMRTVHDAWWAQLKTERSRKHGDFQARARRNLEKNYERHRKATQALEHCRARADELRSQISSAWNGDWAARAQGWLSELEDKIADIERSVEQIEGWIREDEGKLD